VSAPVLHTRRSYVGPVSVDLARALDKAHEDKSLEEIIDASTAALAGVTDVGAEHLAAAFNIKTVRQLGANKFFAVAAASRVTEGISGVPTSQPAGASSGVIGPG
jgi:hypothetical protein